MSKKQNKKLLTPEILKQALVGSVKKLDPTSFVIITDATEIVGKGFREAL